MEEVTTRCLGTTIIDNYSCLDVNDEPVLLEPDKAMQFGKALERVMRNIVEANPKYVPSTS